VAHKLAWIWSERTVRCSTWNRCLDLAVAPRHTGRMCGLRALEVPPGKRRSDRRGGRKPSLGSLMSGGSKCSDTAGRSVGLFSRSRMSGPGGLRRNRVLGSELERGEGCFTWNQMDSSTRRSRAVGCSTWNNVGRRAANRSATNCGWATFRGREVGAAPESGYTEVDVHQPVQRELGCHRQLALGGKAPATP